MSLLPDADLFYQVVTVGAGFMDVVFLGIVIYEAWKIPAPLQVGVES